MPKQCFNPDCRNGRIPIMQMQHGIDDLHKAHQKEPTKLLPVSRETMPCPDCQNTTMPTDGQPKKKQVMPRERMKRFIKKG